MQASMRPIRTFVRPNVAALALLIVGALAGCKVTTEDIEYWKGTVKGPGKIVSVMLADKYDMELRKHAALALVDMERQDRDGTADLQQALQRLDEEKRHEIIRLMVPGLQQLMKQADGKSEGSATPRQIRAKDAAFLLITHAPPDVKATLTVDVVNWYVEDFNGRSLAGNYSAEQVVRALGSPAAKVLVGGLKARLPPQALVKMAELIGQIADSEAKRTAAERLVAIEKEMQSADFLNWIKDSVREQAKAQNIALDEKKLESAAQKNRDNFVLDGAIPAMKWLANEPAVKTRLLALASDPTPGEANTERRVRALQALEGKVTKADLQPLLAMALDTNTPVQVRDYAFDRVGDIKAPEALPSLWPLMSGSDARLRWRAGELILGIGGPSIVNEFFAKLPSGNGEFPAEELEGYALRLGQMQPLPMDAMRQQLNSPDWWDRVIAIRFFERKGNADDVKKLEALKSDQAKTKGLRWGSLKTVGDVAEEAYNAAKTRLSVNGA